MSLMTSTRPPITSYAKPLDIVFCIDRSESMGYGFEKAKLSEAKHLTLELVKCLSSGDRVAIVAFDNVASIYLPLTPISELKNFDATIEHISERGNTCLVSGIKASKEAFDLEKRIKRIIILSDGRVNLSFDGNGGFEGSTSAEKELTEACIEFERLGINVVAIALGADAFIMPLKVITNATEGCLILDVLRDFSQLIMTLRSGTMQIPLSFKQPLLERRLEFASIPSELPAGQPTWSLESLNIHVAVVAEEMSSSYASARQAVVSNPTNQRFARVSLISIEDDIFKGYRERLPKTTGRVRSSDVILLDKSYRLELELDKDTVVDLMIC